MNRVSPLSLAANGDGLSLRARGQWERHLERKSQLGRRLAWRVRLFRNSVVDIGARFCLSIDRQFRYCRRLPCASRPGRVREALVFRHFGVSNDKICLYRIKSAKRRQVAAAGKGGLCGRAVSRTTANRLHRESPRKWPTLRRRERLAALGAHDTLF